MPLTAPAPLVPVSVAVSVTESPFEMFDALAAVVMAGGGGTAAADSDRSWFPPDPSNPFVLMW